MTTPYQVAEELNRVNERLANLYIEFTTNLCPLLGDVNCPPLDHKEPAEGNHFFAQVANKLALIDLQIVCLEHVAASVEKALAFSETKQPTPGVYERKPVYDGPSASELLRTAR